MLMATFDAGPHPGAWTRLLKLRTGTLATRRNTALQRWALSNLALPQARVELVTGLMAR